MFSFDLWTLFSSNYIFFEINYYLPVANNHVDQAAMAHLLEKLYYTRVTIKPDLRLGVWSLSFLIYTLYICNNMYYVMSINKTSH